MRCFAGAPAAGGAQLLDFVVSMFGFAFAAIDFIRRAFGFAFDSFARLPEVRFVVELVGVLLDTCERGIVGTRVVCAAARGLDLSAAGGERGHEQQTRDEHHAENNDQREPVLRRYVLALARPEHHWHGPPSEIVGSATGALKLKAT